MLFAIICHDKPSSGHIRSQTRPAHLEYLSGFAAKAHMVGPLQSDDQQSMIGSLLIMNFDNRDEADEFGANDPYALAGLFESVSISPWIQVLPKPE
jgi:hypothetical protein